MRILFISTWFPYPPDQGSRIRAFHLLRALAEQHQVQLVSFKDREIAPEWVEHLNSYCDEIHIVEEAPFSQSKLGEVFGWFSTRPRAVVGSHSHTMQNLVAEICKGWQPQATIALTFAAAPYALLVNGGKRIVDVDNLLTLMLKEQIGWASNIFERARRFTAFLKFRRFERELYRQFDLCFVTSKDDVNRIREYIPLADGQVIVVPNGVDTQQLRPAESSNGTTSMIYPGALTYGPNLDAMSFFTKEILPAIHQKEPAATLRITGSTRDVNLAMLDLNMRVQLTGYVEDIHSLVSQSAVCVVPLRQGAGTRLKILEAMALGTPVVSTSKGAEGLEVEPDRHLLLADSPTEFADQVLSLFHNQGLHNDISKRARQLVEQKYDWDQIGADLRASISSLMEV